MRVPLAFLRPGTFFFLYFYFYTMAHSPCGGGVTGSFFFFFTLRQHIHGYSASPPMNIKVPLPPFFSDAQRNLPATDLLDYSGDGDSGGGGR